MAHNPEDGRKLPSIKSLNLHRGQAIGGSGGVQPDCEPHDASPVASPDSPSSSNSHIPLQRQQRPLDSLDGSGGIEGTPSEQFYYASSLPFQPHFAQSNLSTTSPPLYFEDAFPPNHQYDYQPYISQSQQQPTIQSRHQQATTPTPSLPTQMYVPVQPQSFEGWSPQASNSTQYHPSQGVNPPREAAPLDPSSTTAYPLEVALAGHIDQSDEGKRSKRSMITTILEHCNAIYTFASRYASLSLAQPTVGIHSPIGYPSIQTRNRQPPASEVREMAQRARLVLDLIERIKRRTPAIQTPSSVCADVEKRGLGGIETAMKHGGSETPSVPLLDDSTVFRDLGARSVAEKDMQTIRSKRSAATQLLSGSQLAHEGTEIGKNASAIASTGHGGSERDVKKTRKKGRPSLPGKCHSCNIRETPEWRRGPDGARTLCNACGLHYAKLLRRRDKALNSPFADSTDTAPIDTDMVRASSQRGMMHATHTGSHQPRRGGEVSTPPHDSTSPTGPTYHSLDPRDRILSLPEADEGGRT